MPLIQVTMIEGRTAEAKASLLQALTQAAVDTVGAPRESIRVILQEVPAAHWAVGGVAKSTATSMQSAAQATVQGAGQNG